MKATLLSNSRLSRGSSRGERKHLSSRFFSSTARHSVWLDAGNLECDVTINSVTFPDLPMLNGPEVIGHSLITPPAFQTVRCSEAEVEWLSALAASELQVEGNRFQFVSRPDRMSNFRIDHLNSGENSIFTLSGGTFKWVACREAP